jgi:hypothetical protein
MAHAMHQIETSRLAPVAWPSIASASAQLRRARCLETGRAVTPAVLGNVAPRRAAVPADRRNR